MTGSPFLPAALVFLNASAAGSLLFTGSAPASPAAAVRAQSDARAELQARIKRVSADLFRTDPPVEDAIRELKAILAIDPSLAEAHMMLGVAYRGLGSPEMLGEAVAELRQALALDGTLGAARLYLAFVYLDLGRFDRARDEMAAALEKTPNQPQFLAVLGEAERRLNNPARAVELLRRAVPAAPSFVQARYYLGLALLDLGQKEDGLAELEIVVKTGPGVVEPYLTLGTAYLDAGRVDAGLEILSQGTHVDRGRPDLRIQLARAYRLKRRFAEAAQQLDIAAPRVRTTVASSFAHQPQIEFEYYVERGLLAAGRAQYGAAATALKQALDLDPEHGPTHRELSIVYSRLGNTKLAAQHAARAAALGSPLPSTGKAPAAPRKNPAGTSR